MWANINLTYLCPGHRLDSNRGSPLPAAALAISQFATLSNELYSSKGALIHGAKGFNLGLGNRLGVQYIRILLRKQGNHAPVRGKDILKAVVEVKVDYRSGFLTG